MKTKSDPNKLLERAQHLHGEAQAFEERVQFIEQQIVELRDFEGGLHAFDATTHKEIFANLGKGVFIPADVRGKQLYVDVGAGVIVKKNVSQVSQVISEQLERLELMKGEAQEHLSNLQEEFRELFAEINELKDN